MTAVAIGLAPGIAVGTLIVARVDQAALKLGTFVVLLPLILLQAAGYRRPLHAERSAGFAFGTAIGLLYSVTTISGPPLAFALNNQGLSKPEFRAALGFVRLIESTVTVGAYVAAGLFTAPSIAVIPLILPSVAIGVPIGALAIRHMAPEMFRRICMSFDAWVVSFGISTLLRQRHVIESVAAYLVMATVILIDGWLLYRFVSTARRAEVICAA